MEVKAAPRSKTQAAAVAQVAMRSIQVRATLERKTTRNTSRNDTQAQNSVPIAVPTGQPTSFSMAVAATHAQAGMAKATNMKNVTVSREPTAEMMRALCFA